VRLSASEQRACGARDTRVRIARGEWSAAGRTGKPTPASGAPRPGPRERAGGRPVSVSFNHVGQCVTDLARSKRFYCELLGFSFQREINPPDDMSAQLLGLDAPLGMTASYLARDGLVLELIHFGAPDQTQQFESRGM